MRHTLKGRALHWRISILSSGLECWLPKSKREIDRRKQDNAVRIESSRRFKG
jgi:hypothetical protein